MAGAATNFELLTPRGHGGVAVVAVHGQARWQAAAVWLRTADGAVVQPTPGPQLATLVLDGVATDQVLLVDRPQLATLELHLHGSPAVVRALEAAVGGFAAAAVSPRRALLQSARSRSQLTLCLEQGEIDFAAHLAELSRLDRAERLVAWRGIAARSELLRAQLTPCRLVLCGAQNAGKSTLMNRLLFQERVLTGDLPGLTRDPVHELAVLDGYPYDLVDTAGEGPVAPGVDQAALDRSRQLRQVGLGLLVVDGSRQPGVCDRGLRNPRTLVLRSKADLPAAVWPPDFVADLSVSCLDPGQAAVLRRVVGERLRRFRRLPPAGPVGGVAAVTTADRESLDRVLATDRAKS